MIATPIHKIANSLAAFFGRSIENRRAKPGFEQAANYAGIAATFDTNAKAQCDEAFGRGRRVVIETNADALGRGGDERDDWLR
jgi:hypothetical protein